MSSVSQGSSLQGSNNENALKHQWFLQHALRVDHTNVRCNPITGLFEGTSEANKPAEKMSNAVAVQMRKAYWDTMKNHLYREPPNYLIVIERLIELRDMCGKYMNDQAKSNFFSKIDIKSLREKVEDEEFDWLIFIKLISIFVETLETLESPADHEVTIAKIKTLTEKAPTNHIAFNDRIIEIMQVFFNQMDVLSARIPEALIKITPLHVHKSSELQGFLKLVQAGVLSTKSIRNMYSKFVNSLHENIDDSNLHHITQNPDLFATPKLNSKPDPSPLPSYSTSALESTTPTNKIPSIIKSSLSSHLSKVKFASIPPSLIPASSSSSNSPSTVDSSNLIPQSFTLELSHLSSSRANEILPLLELIGATASAVALADKALTPSTVPADPLIVEGEKLISTQNSLQAVVILSVAFILCAPLLADVAGDRSIHADMWNSIADDLLASLRKPGAQLASTADTLLDSIESQKFKHRQNQISNDAESTVLLSEEVRKKVHEAMSSAVKIDAPVTQVFMKRVRTSFVTYVMNKVSDDRYSLPSNMLGDTPWQLQIAIKKLIDVGDSFLRIMQGHWDVYKDGVYLPLWDVAGEETAGSSQHNQRTKKGEDDNWTVLASPFRGDHAHGVLTPPRT